MLKNSKSFEETAAHGIVLADPCARADRLDLGLTGGSRLMSSVQLNSYAKGAYRFEIGHRVRLELRLIARRCRRLPLRSLLKVEFFELGRRLDQYP